MTTNKDNSSSFGTIIFTTNIPGDKEHTLDPTVISYSDNPDLKITKTANKIYYYSDKIINTSFFTNLERTNILNILFNKNRFESNKCKVLDLLKSDAERTYKNYEEMLNERYDGSAKMYVHRYEKLLQND